MPRAVLIVEPYESFRSQLSVIAEDAGWECCACETFEAARQILTARRPQVLVSNIRLGLYNGIQLAYLAKIVNPPAVVIIFASDKDRGAGHDAQQASAFFERQTFLPYSLTSYLMSSLPPRDRRDPDRVDRRAQFRGGRRASDLPFLHASRLGPTGDLPRQSAPDKGV